MMHNARLLSATSIALVALLAALGLPGCSCGFDCHSDDDDKDSGPALLSLGFSDALPETLTSVVIEVDAITFRRGDGDDVVVDRFTIDDDGINILDGDTFQVDLLRYRGVNQLTVITDLELEADSYDEVLLTVRADDSNSSYVEEATSDTRKPLVISGDTLRLPGIRVPSGTQAFTVEFGLAQALRYREADDSYLLTSDGVRIENTAITANLTGQVDSDLFDLATPCDAKADPEQGNRIYLYQGRDLLPANLGDVFTTASAVSVPEDTVAPFAVAALLQTPLTGNWDYAFGYLPAGDYTMAFACDTAGDDPVDFDGLAIPLPSQQVYEISLSEGESARCNISEVPADC